MCEKTSCVSWKTPACYLCNHSLGSVFFMQPLLGHATNFRDKKTRVAVFFNTNREHQKNVNWSLFVIATLKCHHAVLIYMV
jgi:hypothetical protein